MSKGKICRLKSEDHSLNLKKERFSLDYHNDNVFTLPFAQFLAQKENQKVPLSKLNKML